MPFLSLVIVAAMVIALIDVITRADDQVKHLPKFAWILLVVLVPLVGVILWFAVGREYAPREAPHPRGYHDAPLPPVPVRQHDPRTTEQQLADLEREIEVERLRAELARRRRELGEDPAAGPIV